MELRSLLLTQDDELIETLQAALDDLGIGADVYSTPPRAGEEIGGNSGHRYDAVIVDFDVPGADQFLRDMRSLSNNAHALTFAIVNREIGLPTAFAMGANLALQKPISLESARSSLRAAYGLIMQERRRHFRYPIETLVMMNLDEHTTVVATTTNISEGGMALKCDRNLPLNGLVKLSFSLPGVKGEIVARATVVWEDSIGHAGIRFEKFARDSRESLSDWLQKQTSVFYL